jgi:hypothetical protein
MERFGARATPSVMFLERRLKLMAAGSPGVDRLFYREGPASLAAPGGSGPSICKVLAVHDARRRAGDARRCGSSGLRIRWMPTLPDHPHCRNPMTISMYQASVPRFANILGNLSNIMDKTQAHIDARKIADATLTGYRLFPDMLPLTTQVQIACDAAKGVVARLAGIDAPVFEDNEKTIADLKARIAKTIAFIQSVSPAQIDGTEDKAIVTKRGDKETHYKGMQFLLGHAIPNFYFHVTTTYNILRHNGVEIGKRDYLGNP